MPHTIGFDATAALRQAAGIGRYVRELLAALARRDDGDVYRIFCLAGGAIEGALPPLGEHVRVRRVPISDRLSNTIWHRARLPLPVQVFTGRVDLFHSPDFTLPPAPGVPSILTVHDLAFLRVPQCAYPTLRRYLERVVPRSARRATHIIAVSQATRRDLIDLLDIPPERIQTVAEGVSHEFRPLETAYVQPVLRRLGLSQPYVLAVGTLEPRKNYVRLLEAYASLRQRGVEARLVIAGGKGWLYEPIFRRLRELRLEDQVTFVRPPDRDLVALYNGAQALVYPSLYEGFGIPPLEAMACGIPVACSTSASLPEVVGDAACTFDPADAGDMAGVLERVLHDDRLRADLRSRGLQRAKGFTWDRAAAETQRVYREVLGDA